MSAETVERHSLNRSSSKARYSFSRSGRFPTPPRSHGHIQYSSLSGLSHTGYSFGAAQRSDFTCTPMRRD